MGRSAGGPPSSSACGTATRGGTRSPPSGAPKRPPRSLPSTPNWPRKPPPPRPARKSSPRLPSSMATPSSKPPPTLLDLVRAFFYLFLGQGLEVICANDEASSAELTFTAMAFDLQTRDQELNFSFNFEFPSFHK